MNGFWMLRKRVMKEKSMKKIDKNKVIGIIGTRKRDTDEDFRLTWEAFCGIYEERDSICSGLCPQGGGSFCRDHS